MLPPQNPAINPKNNSAEFQRYSPENTADSTQNVGAGLAPNTFQLSAMREDVGAQCIAPVGLVGSPGGRNALRPYVHFVSLPVFLFFISLH
jgi:hypothetical protein